MFPRSNKKRGDDPVRLGVKVMVGAASICGGFLFLILMVSAVHSAVVKPSPSVPGTNGIVRVVSHTYEHGDDELYDLNRKQGPYNYGNGPLYPNVTSTSGTLTVTLTSANLTTKTVLPSMTISSTTIDTVFVSTTSAPITTSTETLAVIPYGTFDSQTVTSSSNSTLVSSSMDVQGFPVTSSIPSDVFPTEKTVIPITTHYTEMSAITQSSVTQSPAFTSMPTITVTTTIFYSTSDSEEFTGTETVTITPHVTTTNTTTVTLAQTTLIGSTVTKTDSSAGVVTVTVYVSVLSSQTQTGATDTSMSTMATPTSISAPLTTTIVQTVVPIPLQTLTTKCTESATTVFTPLVPIPASHSSVTIATTPLTSTIVGSSDGITFTMEVSPINSTAGTNTAMSTATGPSIGTTCTTSSATVNSMFIATSVFTTMVTLSTTHLPIPFSESSSWSVSSINGTGAHATGTVATITSSPTTTADSTTFDSGSTIYTTVQSTITVHPTPTNGTFSSNADSDRKLGWSGSNGGGSGTCVVMLVAIVSLVVQVFVM